MLPQKDIRWLLNQPESILSTEAVRRQRNGIKYLPTGLDPKTTLLFIDKIIGRSLSQNLDHVIPSIYEEVKYSVDEILGTDTISTTEIDLSSAMAAITNRVTSRVVFGLPICRDRIYLLVVRLFVVLMGISTLVIGQLPPWSLRPVVGSFLTIPTFFMKRVVLFYVEPLVRERMVSPDHIHQQEKSSNAPQDFITQSLRSVKAQRVSIHGDMSVFLSEQLLILVCFSMSRRGIHSNETIRRSLVWLRQALRPPICSLTC